MGKTIHKLVVCFNHMNWGRVTGTQIPSLNSLRMWRLIFVGGFAPQNLHPMVAWGWKITWRKPGVTVFFSAWVAMTHPTHPSDKGVFSNAFTNDLLRNLGEPGRHNWKAHKYPYLFVPELGVLSMCEYDWPLEMDITDGWIINMWLQLTITHFLRVHTPILNNLEPMPN